MPAAAFRQIRLLLVAVAVAAVAPKAMAQPEHAHHQADRPPGPTPVLPGQDGFGAIAEIVTLLEADPTTDWSKVDLERLRRHLIDMNEVTLRMEVASHNIDGGARFILTGGPRTVAAARRMFTAHVGQLGESAPYRVVLSETGGGLRVAITARDPSDGATTLKIRALGPVGFLTLGDHHRPHHLGLARGDPIAAHEHR